MHNRPRNWLLAVGAVAVVWIGQPIWSRNLDFFLEQRGWEKALNTAIGSMPEWIASALALLRLNGFWGGAFTVLAIWGCLEGLYAIQRRRQKIDSAEDAAPLSPSDPTVENIEKTITKIQVETNIERRLFPDRSCLDEKAVRKFIFDFISSLAMSGDTVLFETRDSDVSSLIGASRLVAIDASALANFSFKEVQFGTVRLFSLVSVSGAEMKGLHIRKADIATVIDKLRQTAPLVRALHTSGQP